MPRNGSGVFSPPSANYPAVSGTLIESADRNAIDSDIATAITNSIAVNGESVVTNNIPFGGNKLTAVGAGQARTDAMTLANAQDGTGLYVATVGGTADVITISPNPSVPAYVAGQEFSFIASGANTTNVTINVSGLGAKAITKNGATALVAGDIPNGFLVTVKYDGTRFQLVGSKDAPLVSPAFTTPNLGTPSAGTLTNCTGLPLTTGVTGVLADDNGGTGQSTYATGDLIYASGTNTLAKRAIGTTGQILTVTGGVPTWESGGLIASGTAINTTSGTSHDFTGIPSWAKRITFMLSGVSTNSTSPLIIQLGDSGGIENTGYASIASYANVATAFGNSGIGFLLEPSSVSTAAAIRNGFVTFVNVTGNTWVSSGSMGDTTLSVCSASSGGKTLSATLDRVRLTTVNGTDTFDAGSVNIFYE